MLEPTTRVSDTGKKYGPKNLHFYQLPGYADDTDLGTLFQEPPFENLCN